MKRVRQNRDRSSTRSGDRVRSVMHIVIAFFVLSYIAFDVLDLDLSSFPLQQPAHKAVLIVAEVPAATELSYLPGHDALWTKQAIVDSPVSQHAIRLNDNRILRIAWFHTSRSQIYRLIYPPSSTPDSDSSDA